MKHLKVGLTTLALATASLHGTHAAVPTVELTEKQKVVALLNSIESGDASAVKYVNGQQYKQHNLNVGDGLKGFGEVLSLLPEGSARVDVQRVFQDGEYVFSHTSYDFFGPKIGFDIFRFEAGLIVEHWDNLQETLPVNASGRSQVDGPTIAVDLDKTAENKAIIKGLIDDVFLGANPQKITDYISTASYHQHNPHVADGLAALGEALTAMAEAGTPMRYTKSHLILGEGNFVLAVSEGEFLAKHVAFYDLFRIEGGKVVEHWDTIESIPEEGVWKNNNGKFGFDAAH